MLVATGEMGRTPKINKNGGRDHWARLAPLLLYGGGLKGGQVIGATDELGLFATEDKLHVHDLHASVLHLLGLDHLKLTFRFQGRDFRLTDVAGKVIPKLLA